MKSMFFTLAVAALSVNGLPNSLRKRQVTQVPPLQPPNVTDTDILNFALTLEHLESAFYKEALSRFDESAFQRAGLPAFARGRFLQLAEQENQHVQFLSSALGSQATQPCTYSFPFSDPRSFAALSLALEGVGTSAYAGAAQFLVNKGTLTAAAVVLSTEARHSAWVGSAVEKANPWGIAFDTPLGLNEVFTLAAAFITSCPPSNPPLPVKAFPALAVSFRSLAPGSLIAASYPNAMPTDVMAFLLGLGQTFAPVVDGKVIVPPGLNGTVYAVVVSTNATAPSDATIRAGPAIIDFSFDSRGRLIDSASP